MNSIRNLADGQLTIAKSVLYTCPAGYRAVVTNIKVTNVHSSTHRFVLYFKKSGGSSRTMFDHMIDEQDTSIDEDSTTLEAGDAIEGQCPDGATYMDYKISGYEVQLLATA